MGRSLHIRKFIDKDPYSDAYIHVLLKEYGKTVDCAMTISYGAHRVCIGDHGVEKGSRRIGELIDMFKKVRGGLESIIYLLEEMSNNE